VRIAKAERAGQPGKVKALQRLLTTSYSARMLAVRQVTTNAGRNTPGVDGVIWRTPEDKHDAARELTRHGYRPQPLRRTYIPKRNGQRRPLGIPTMKDRAMQALHNLALVPVAEVRADIHSYGFRPKRSVADAIGQCFVALAKRRSPTWVLDCDVKSCFDRISHDWLLANVPMDKRLLQLWLSAGVIDTGQYQPTTAGTPQGGTISPTLMNLTLDGLEAAVRRHLPRRGAKVNVVRYADDFVITGVSEALLREQVLPAVHVFLAERGLALSLEKTHIRHIDEGFDFLGFNVRKYRGKLLIQRAKEAVRAMESALKAWAMTAIAWPLADFVRVLNRKLQGWAYQCRFAVVKVLFGRIDENVYHLLQRWSRKRHPGKTARWRFYRYWRHFRGSWRFCAVKNGKPLAVFKASELPVRRHVKIQSAATPFDPAYRAYFRQRWQRQRMARRLDHKALTRHHRTDPAWIPST
jgi:RNA-directed DNA polymerase